MLGTFSKDFGANMNPAGEADQISMRFVGMHSNFGAITDTKEMSSSFNPREV